VGGHLLLQVLEDEVNVPTCVIILGKRFGGEPSRWGCLVHLDPWW
jgi:hypothetical protein